MAAPRVEDYLVNITPWAKQQEAIAFVADLPLSALIMEQRTGKTPVAIAKVLHHYHRGEIDAMFVAAMPSGVPRGWAAEIDGDPVENKPARVPPWVKRMVVVWDSGRARTKAFQARLDALLKFDGLAVFLVNGEATITPTFRTYAAKFMRKRRVFAIVDETSLVIKAPGNKRTKVLNGARSLTKYRMILDGTPADESPLDLYSQYGWLSNNILGQPTALAFRHYYAEWETKTVWDPKKKVQREYPAVKEDPETGRKMYLHIDELRERMSRVSFFCSRKECFDIPDKIYTPYRFDLTPAQRRVYDDLRSTYEAELVSGARVSATNVLVRYMRLQQVASNFWPGEPTIRPCPDCSGKGCETCDGIGGFPARTDPVPIDDKVNPRLQAAAEVLSSTRGSGIVWARFTRDIDDIIRLAPTIGRTAVRYDGLIGANEKAANKASFQTGQADLIVANQGVAQRGHDLSAAAFHLYYSNTFSGVVRRQTEDRTEVAGRTRGTGIIDLIADDTVDEDIVESHLLKRELADVVMGRSAGSYFRRT